MFITAICTYLARIRIHLYVILIGLLLAGPMLCYSGVVSVAVMQATGKQRCAVFVMLLYFSSDLRKQAGVEREKRGNRCLIMVGKPCCLFWHYDG